LQNRLEFFNAIFCFLYDRFSLVALLLLFFLTIMMVSDTIDFYFGYFTIFVMSVRQ